MFNRYIINELDKWLAQSSRKPLILRGARQVGKTTLVKQFANRFEQYIYLNLELPEDRQPFEQFTSIETLVQALFFIKNCSLDQKKRTLIFIDEIQEVPAALNILRYFLEQEPDIPVIAAGSMLETLFDKNISFPVGRVEYKVVRPASFPEFLDAMGETAALQQIEHVPVATFSHSKLLQLFHTYALIGGMPEIVKTYSEKKDLLALSSIYDSLIASYMDDVEKYASSDSQIQHIRHVIRSSFPEAGSRIKFEGFGNSPYRSRDMGEALRTLEKALLLQLLFPVTSAQLPLLPDVKKSPKLQILDTGLLNYAVGIQREILGTSDLNSVYQGKVIEHLIGQEILSVQNAALDKLNFWVREKKTSNAEVDFVFSFEGKLIPVEVKSGKEGTLKSLHLFMDEAPHSFAVRFYSGELSVTEAQTTSGKVYQLLNLPYYLGTQLEKYLDWFVNSTRS
ncbi:MAG: AAA family ATPase [Prolixibacteraceae bacterium]|nr:AAA family ATPase [Prolixibacteraceae bacterium]